jgi:hypothetical protein
MKLPPNMPLNREPLTSMTASVFLLPHLQQGSRRVPPHCILAQLVNLVKQHHWVVYTCQEGEERGGGQNMEDICLTLEAGRQLQSELSNLAGSAPGSCGRPHAGAHQTLACTQGPPACTHTHTPALLSPWMMRPGMAPT